MKPSHQTEDSAAPTLTDCQAILRILRLWHRQAPRLIVGVLLALIALCLGLVLMQASGLRLASSVLGEVIITTALLRWVGGGRVVMRYAERLFTHDAMFRALADLRVWFFHSLAQGAAAGLGFRRAGDMLSRLVSDIGTLDGLYLRILIPFACACLTLPILVVQLGRQSVVLGALVGGLFACSAFLVPYLIARSGRADGERLAKNLAALRISVLDMVGGLREIRAFGAEGRILSHVQAEDATLLAGQMKLARRAAFANASAFLCGQAAVFLVLLTAAGAFSLHVSPLVAVGILFLTVAAFESAGTLTRAGLQAGAMGAAARRVVEVAGTAPNATQSKALTEAPADTHIHLEDVKFRWAPDRPPVFDGLTLDIPAGTRVAILALQASENPALQPSFSKPRRRMPGALRWAEKILPTSAQTPCGDAWRGCLRLRICLTTVFARTCSLAARMPRKTICGKRWRRPLLPTWCARCPKGWILGWVRAG